MSPTSEMPDHAGRRGCQPRREGGLMMQAGRGAEDQPRTQARRTRVAIDNSEGTATGGGEGSRTGGGVDPESLMLAEFGFVV